MSHRQDRLLEYAKTGAQAAADTLTRVLERDVRVEPPRCQKLELGELPASVFPPNEETLAIFADLIGAATGQAGIALPKAQAGELTRLLFKDGSPELHEERAHSALCELGNIVLSAAAGAIAQLVGGVVIPSVPRLADDMAGALLLELIHPELRRLPAYLAETDLVEHDGPLRLRFVWIPGA